MSSNTMNSSEFFRGKTILVTGASGFIGMHLCARLHELGANVHGTSRSVRKGGFVSRWHQVDLGDSMATQRLIDIVAPDILFHLASFVSGDRRIEYVLPALQSNLVSTVNLLVSATNTCCTRIVLTGSLEEAEGDVSMAVPASPYAAAKGAASSYASMFHSLYGTPVVTARLFMVYGPGQGDHTKLVPYVTLSLLRGQVARLMSGARKVDWIYIDDVVDAYLALASGEGVHGQIFDVGSGEFVAVRDIVGQLVDIIDPALQPIFGSVADRPLERIRVANVNHTYQALSWKPATTLNQGLRQTVEWYRKNVL